MRRNGVAGGDFILKFVVVRHIISQKIASQIRSVSRGIVELEPIVVSGHPAGIIGQGASVAGHPLVNEYHQGSGGAVVSPARRNVVEILTIEELSVRERAEGMVGSQAGVIDVIEDLLRPSVGA